MPSGAPVFMSPPPLIPLNSISRLSGHPNPTQHTHTHARSATKSSPSLRRGHFFRISDADGKESHLLLNCSVRKRKEGGGATGQNSRGKQ